MIHYLPHNGSGPPPSPHGVAFLLQKENVQRLLVVIVVEVKSCKPFFLQENDQDLHYNEATTTTPQQKRYFVQGSKLRQYLHVCFPEEHLMDSNHFYLCKVTFCKM